MTTMKGCFCFKSSVYLLVQTHTGNDDGDSVADGYDDGNDLLYNDDDDGNNIINDYHDKNERIF